MSLFIFSPRGQRGDLPKKCAFGAVRLRLGERGLGVAGGVVGERATRGGPVVGKGQWLSKESKERSESGVRCNDVASKNRASSRTGQSSRPGWNGRNKERWSSHPNQTSAHSNLGRELNHVASASWKSPWFPCIDTHSMLAMHTGHAHPTAPNMSRCDEIRRGQIGGRLGALAMGRRQRKEVPSANTGKH